MNDTQNGNKSTNSSITTSDFLDISLIYGWGKCQHTFLLNSLNAGRNDTMDLAIKVLYVLAKTRCVSIPGNIDIF